MALTPLEPPEFQAKKRHMFAPRLLRSAWAAHLTAGSSERTLLGAEHPFVRAKDDLRSVLGQAGAVTAVLAGGLAAGMVGVTWSWALAGAAGTVLAVLLVILAALRHRVSDEAIGLLLTGYETDSIPAVQHQRNRLTARRTRRALSKTYRTIAHQARPRTRPLMASERPLFDPRVVRGVLTEVLAVSRLLEEDQVPASTVARAERLITAATSSLYGADTVALKSDLRRILDDVGVG